MSTDFFILLTTAGSIGFIHTLLGPDHYLPFVAMGRARNWSMRKTMAITALSGIGHVLSSVVLGAVGLLFGIEVLRLTEIESFRGEIAGWLLFGFGLAYMLWGIRRAVRQTAKIGHEHGGHTHKHTGGALLHRHEHTEADQANITPWVIFTIFVFGPCEPLIPVLMYPAAQADALSVFSVAMVFSLFTIGTMITLVYASLKGLKFVPAMRMERYSHALAGFVIASCGAAMQFLGL